MAYRKTDNQDRSYFISETDYKLIKENISRVGMSSEQKIKIGNSNRGRKHSQEARKNMSKGQKRRYETSGASKRTEE